MIDLAPTPTYIQEKRACIAAFMDAYPDIFAAPTQAVSWSGFVEQATPPDEREERILDQATGRIVQAIRSAQDRTPSDFDMKSMLDQAKDEGFGELQADPGVLEIAAGEHLDEDVATMARAMTLYKEAVKMGMAEGGELQQTIESSFGGLPAETPFMRDLLSTAKQIVLIDLSHAMRAA
ncbi:hypothetical protein ACNI65_17405 [Roseateles sp. So40a]|uniref:hypothetical protein n=1 Tax=Roseateles sp. So40a TaxID=3400226 RepID=UPI003A861045